MQAVGKVGTRMDITLMTIFMPDRKVIYCQMCSAVKLPPSAKQICLQLLQQHATTFSVVSGKYYQLLYTTVQVASCMQFFLYTHTQSMPTWQINTGGLCRPAMLQLLRWDAALITHCRILWKTHVAANQCSCCKSSTRKVAQAEQIKQLMHGNCVKQNRIKQWQATSRYCPEMNTLQDAAHMCSCLSWLPTPATSHCEPIYFQHASVNSVNFVHWVYRL